MRVAITATLDYSFFSNGLIQNIISLYELLEKCGFKVSLLDFGDKSRSGSTHAHNKLNKKNILRWGEFTRKQQHFDLVICAGVSLDENLKDSLTKANPKIKTVGVHYGNNLINLMCEWFSKVPPKRISGHPDCPPMKLRHEKLYEETWISEHYLFAKEFYEYTDESPVRTMPYIWSPSFIEGEAIDHGININYIPVKKPNLAVVEPNINISKSFLIPMLAISSVLESSPDIFEHACIYGSDSFFRNREFLKEWIHDCTSLGENKDRFTFFPRKPIPGIMHVKNPAIISHQHLNELNYTHLEALFCGYPLIHNSPPFKEFGYFYEGFNLLEAAEKIKEAIEQHNDNLSAYLEKGKEAAWKYSPENRSNIECTKKLVLDLFK